MTGFEYTKNARVTTYASTKFRSQLEAQWAALFDLVQIPWEYEPEILSGWLPDFRLWGRFCVEVKPIPATGYSMATDDFNLIKKAVTAEYTLLLGDAPSPVFGCLVTGDDKTMGGRTVLFDPDAQFKLISVDGNGDRFDLYDNLRSEWAEAKRTVQAASPRKTAQKRRALSANQSRQRRAMRRDQ